MGQQELHLLRQDLHIWNSAYCQMVFKCLTIVHCWLWQRHPLIRRHETQRKRSPRRLEPPQKRNNWPCRSNPRSSPNPRATDPCLCRNRWQDLSLESLDSWRQARPGRPLVRSLLVRLVPRCKHLALSRTWPWYLHLESLRGPTNLPSKRT